MNHNFPADILQGSFILQTPLMSMKAWFLFLCLVLLRIPMKAQCMAPVWDIQNFVYVFNGQGFDYIENLPMKEFKVGRDKLVYVNQNSRLRMYYAGKTYPVTDAVPEYYVTDHFFVYRNLNQVRMLYNNEFITLENQFADSLWVSDSLVVWNNRLGQTLAFYGGKTYQIESWNVRRAKIGDNVFAFIDQLGQFKVFYRGKLTTLEIYEPVNFIVNRDLVVYIDQFSNYKFYHEGIQEESSINNLQEYYIGERFFAYINVLDQFFAIHEGEETLLLQNHPKMIDLRENVLIYADNNNNFYAYYKGKIYWLERYLPLSYKIDNDIVVYQDINGRLKAFYFGKTDVEVSDQIVNQYNLYNYTVTYSLQPGETKVWCDKKTYTYR
jgi:hypothetical protein